MNIESLYEANKDLVVRKETSNPDLFVMKYRRSVFFKSLWNDFLRECRGLVVDSDWNIVSLPFKKIHNYGIEEDAPFIKDDELVFASRKVNGFMIACTWYKDDLLWSTTGSLDSDFIGYAKEIFESWSESQKTTFKCIVEEGAGGTFMFECVHKKDPHIIEEPEGLHFIGYRLHDFNREAELANTSVEKMIWHGTPVLIVDAQYYRFGHLKEIVKNCKHEGFVLCTNDEQWTKIKSPHYLTKKFFMRGNWEKFLRFDKESIDEEFYGLHHWIQEVERERFFELDEMARREYIERWFEENGPTK